MMMFSIMRWIKRHIFLKKSALYWGVALLLLGAIALHTIHFDHHHPHEFFGNDEVQAAMHGEDKKWWLLFELVLALYIGLTLFRVRHNSAIFQNRFFKSIWYRYYFVKIFDPFSIPIRRGIIHPKLCH